MSTDSSVTKSRLSERGPRQSNIELLRIFGMAGVIFLHYYNAGIGGGIKYVTKGSSNEELLILLESINICAVNLFVMITGYFLSQTNKRIVGRALSILFQASIFRVATYAVMIALHKNAFSTSALLIRILPVSWFAVLYAVLYLLSPLANHAYNNTRKKNAILGIVIIFSLWPTVVDLLAVITGSNLNSLSSLGMYGSERGYTIVNFFMCYFIGAFIHDVDLNAISKDRLLLLLIVDVVIIDCWSKWDATAREYCNPFVVLEAALFLMLFLKIDIGANRAINSISSCSLSVYLLHSSFFPLFKIEEYVQKNIGIMAMHIFVTILAIIIFCYVIDRVYKLIFLLLIKKLKTLFPYDL